MHAKVIIFNIENKDIDELLDRYLGFNYKKVKWIEDFSRIKFIDSFITINRCNKKDLDGSQLSSLDCDYFLYKTMYEYNYDRKIFLNMFNGKPKNILEVFKKLSDECEIISIDVHH